MVDEATKPIFVSPNAGAIDAVQSALRLVGFLVGVAVAILTFVRTRDLIGLANYLQSNWGEIAGALSGLCGFAAAAYGVFKSHKRGAQIATAAADPNVPDSVVALKDASKGETNA